MKKRVSVRVEDALSPVTRATGNRDSDLCNTETIASDSFEIRGNGIRKIVWRLGGPELKVEELEEDPEEEF